MPAQSLAGERNFLLAQCSTMTTLGALFIRAALTNDGFATNERRSLRFGLCGQQRRLDGRGVMAVDVGYHVPAVGLKTFWRIVGEPALNLAVDGNTIVVIDRNEFAQPERAGPRAGLVRYALHQTAIAQKDPGMVINNGVPLAIELGRQRFLCQRHPDGIRDTLPQRPGRGLDTGGVAIFWVAWRLAMELPELFQVFGGEFISGEMQQGIDQHRAVAIGQHEPVAVGPIRIRRVVSHQAIPQHLGNIRHTHRRTGVTRFRYLDGVHGKGTNGVGQFSLRRHENSGIAGAVFSGKQNHWANFLAGDDSKSSVLGRGPHASRRASNATRYSV